MMPLVVLAGAIASEVLATVALRMAVTASRLFYIVTVIGYVIAFSLLSVALSMGMPLGVAYGMWTAIGVAATAVIDRVFFKEALTWVMALGIALIIGGVLLVETGAH